MELNLPVALDSAARDASPEGARARLVRAGVLVVAGGVAAFLLMADDARLPCGVPLGALAVAVCAAGIVGAVNALGLSPGLAASSVSGRALALPIARIGASAAVTWGALAGGVHAILPPLVAGALLTGGFVALAASLFALGARLGLVGRDGRPVHRRHGFWLLVAMALLDLPALGVGSLVDPWETHYGEVAREVLARDDWISLWWSWQGFFYSKPVLGIWAQSIAMAVLGVHVEPDHLLDGAFGRLAHPEWAVRVPFVLFAIAGAYLLSKGVARWYGRRAGLLGGLVLATSPHWFLVSHQSMTDMPFVASIAAAVGLVLLAAAADGEELAPSAQITVRGRSFRVGLREAVLGAVVACVAPQILYLVSRNVELVAHGAGAHGFLVHADVVRAGSGLGGCHQAGDPACSAASPVSHLEPWVQALGWTALLVAFLFVCARERRTKPLLYLAAWFFAALGTMAKGPAGLALPALAVLLWFAATRRWSELKQAAPAAGLALVALVVGPWFVAVLVRHGATFTDELIFHDMFNRAFEHVHDTNPGADTSLVYYVEELGYGLFPWTALVPLALVALVRGAAARARSTDGAALLLFWFLVTFALFTFMGTKFHHYILPAVPPAAMLIGIALDALLGEAARADGHRRAMLGAAGVAGALLVVLVARDLGTEGGQDGAARFMWLFTYRYDRLWPASVDVHGVLVAASVAAALLSLALAMPRLRAHAVAGWAVLGLAWGAWGLDVYLPRASPHWGQRALFEAYYAQRAGPEEPVVAYRMNWKGENFYTGNRVPQFGTPEVPAGTPTFATWIHDAREKGTRVVYFVTEPGTVASLRNEVKGKELREVTSRGDCQQFVLVRAVL